LKWQAEEEWKQEAKKDAKDRRPVTWKTPAARLQKPAAKLATQEKRQAKPAAKQRKPAAKSRKREKSSTKRCAQGAATHDKAGKPAFLFFFLL
jgi:hypothetical protein